MLPTSLRSLSITMKPEQLFDFVEPLPESQLRQSTHLPNLTSLKIDAHSVYSLSKAQYESFGQWLQQLPLSSLELPNTLFEPGFTTHLPNTLSYCDIYLQSDLSGEVLTLSFPTPNLTSLSLGLELGTETEWDGVLPSSLTSLDINHETAWHHLPPNLITLASHAPIFMDSDIASLLPRCLETLVFEGHLKLAAIPYLPRSLTELALSQFDPIASEPVTLPPSLTKLTLDCTLDCTPPPNRWKYLPRLLDFRAMVDCSDATVLNFISDLPPTIAVICIYEPSAELIRKLPCQKSLESVELNSSPTATRLNTCLSEMINFPSLIDLHVDHGFDITGLVHLTAPLKHLIVEVRPDYLDKFQLPPSCFNTLVALGYHHAHNVEEDRTLQSPPWLMSLPTSLVSLDLANVTVHPSSLSNLPSTCTNVCFCVLRSEFDFKQIAHLPHTIRLLQLKILGRNEQEDEESISSMKISLNDLLHSLPSQIRQFTSSVALLEPTEHEDTWKPIFHRHLPSLPYLFTFEPETSVVAQNLCMAFKHVKDALRTLCM